MGLSNITLINDSGRELYVLPVPNEDVDFCENFADLGRIFFGGRPLHTVNDLWSIFEEGRLLSYREQEYRLARRFFREYAFKITDGWSGQLDLSNLLSYFRYTAGYWRQLTTATSCRLFICNSLATEAVLFPATAFGQSQALVTITLGDDFIEQQVKIPPQPLTTANIAIFSRGRKLPCGARLRPGSIISSANNHYFFAYTDNGSLEVRETKTDSAIWKSSTNHKTDLGSLIMQADGKLVLSNQIGDELWKSTVTGDRNWGSSLSLNNDGVLVITNGIGQEIWRSKND